MYSLPIIQSCGSACHHDKSGLLCFTPPHVITGVSYQVCVLALIMPCSQANEAFVTLSLLALFWLGLLAVTAFQVISNNFDCVHLFSLGNLVFMFLEGQPHLFFCLSGVLFCIFPRNHISSARVSQLVYLLSQFQMHTTALVLNSSSFFFLTALNSFLY